MIIFVHLGYLRRTDSDSAGAVGLGTGLDFYLEDSGSNINQAGRLDVTWTGATNAAETSKMDFNLMQNGTLTEAATLSTLQRVTGDDAEFKVNGRLDQTHHYFFCFW